MPCHMLFAVLNVQQIEMIIITCERRKKKNAERDIFKLQSAWNMLYKLRSNRLIITQSVRPTLCWLGYNNGLFFYHLRFLR